MKKYEDGSTTRIRSPRMPLGKGWVEITKEEFFPVQKVFKKTQKSS